MKYEINNFIFNYNSCDKQYIHDLINDFNLRVNEIYNFFDIKGLKKQLIINICSELYLFEGRSNTSVAFKDDDLNNYYIYILSYDEFIKRKTHENNNLDYYFKTLLHEFVHVVQEDVGLYRDCLIWLREGLAIVLSNQYGNINYKLNNCLLEDLLNDKRVWYINYYSLVSYIKNTYGINYLKKLINNPLEQKEETIKIYNELENLLDNIK